MVGEEFAPGRRNAGTAPVASSIRRAVEADLPAIRAILREHDEDGPVTTVDIVGPYVRHLMATATSLVAEVDGEVVGYGAAIDAGVAVHLADLFVRADLLSRGIGRPLLAAVLGDAPRRVTFASSDPRAIALYIRAGMTPRWPCFDLEGMPDRIAKPGAVLSVEGADGRRLAELERGWTGADRSLDHGFWASLAGADPFVVADGGEPVALGYGRARQANAARAIDRLVVRPGAEPAGAVLAAIHRASQGGPVAVSVPGPNPALPILLEGGFRIIDHNLFMASDEGLVDPARLLPNPGML